MMLFLLNQTAREFNGGADVVSRDAIVFSDLSDFVSARQCAQQDMNRNPRAANYGFAMMDGRIDHNAIIHR